MLCELLLRAVALVANVCCGGCQGPVNEDGTCSNPNCNVNK